MSSETVDSRTVRDYQIVFENRFEEVSALEGYGADLRVCNSVTYTAMHVADEVVVEQPLDDVWQAAFKAAQHSVQAGLQIGFLVGLDQLELTGIDLLKVKNVTEASHG